MSRSAATDEADRSAWPRASERDVVIPGGRIPEAAVVRRARRVVSARSTAALTADEAHVARDDLGHVALVAFLVVVGARADLALLVLFVQNNMLGLRAVRVTATP